LQKKRNELSRVYVIEGHRIKVAIRRNDLNPDPPLLICNGLGVGMEVLEPLLDALGDRAVIRFDAPGIGGSSAPLTPYTMAGLARVIDALLERLGYREVDILGISWGGAVAQELALNHPQRCRTLILAATTTGVVSVPGNPLAVLLAVNPAQWLGVRFHGRAAGMLFGGDFRGGSMRGNRALPELHGRDLLGFYWQLLAVWGWTSIHRLSGIRQRTLLLYGEDDPLVPLANARIMQSLIPEATLATFDCGHLFAFTRAAGVAATIARFTCRDTPVNFAR
jgi:poly(3-hydroxyoctanoate) depolymerase